MIKLHSIKGLVMWYMHRPARIKSYIARNRRNEERIRQKDTITVVFFASNVSMWHYQGLYEEMLKYPRFKPYIVLSPFNAYTPDQKVSSVKAMRAFFDKKGINYIDYDTDKIKGYDVKGMLKPDILFIPQPYYTVMCKEHRYYRFKDSLLAYYPYGVNYRRQRFNYDEDYYNRAWRRYYENEFTRNDAKELSSVGDINVRVVGYPNADEFMKQPTDVWKPQDKKKKRVIWAPHFTIWGDGWSQNSNFLWMSSLMLDIAEEYIDRIQFAFKPHPRLLSELYKHPDWGKEKADDYYKQWETMQNGQLETGSFFNLFMTSDAMIHDSGSFVAEYLYSGNPVMYVIEDLTPLLNVANEFGKMIYSAHYIGKNESDIRLFITETVLSGNDPLKEERHSVKEKYLLPPNGKTVAENTMDDLLKSLSNYNNK